MPIQTEWDVGNKQQIVHKAMQFSGWIGYDVRESSIFINIFYSSDRISLYYLHFCGTGRRILQSIIC